MKYKVQSIKELGSFKSMFSLEGKVALVTGAGGGIGRSTAAGMAELGAKVVLMDIPAAEDKLAENVKDIQERYGVEAMYVTGDISDPVSVDSFLQQAVDRFGTIHIVHNNAGVGLQPDCPQMPYEMWSKEVSINLTGAFLVARSCAELMKKHGHGGSIITTASMSGLIVNAGVCYSATKAGVNHMSNALAIDYAKDGIRFNSVAMATFSLACMRSSASMRWRRRMTAWLMPLRWIGSVSWMMLSAVSSILLPTSPPSRLPLP